MVSTATVPKVGPKGFCMSGLARFQLPQQMQALLLHGEPAAHVLQPLTRDALDRFCTS